MQLNAFFFQAENIEIEKWKILLEPENDSYASLPVPDLLPFVTPDLARRLGEAHPSGSRSLQKEDVTHFIQSGAWWCPAGKTFGEAPRRQLGMRAVAALISARKSKLGLAAATGVIPSGIQGNLSTLPSFVPTTKPLPVSSRTFSIVASSREYAILNDPADLAQVEKDFSVKLQLIPFDGPVSNAIAKVPDVVVFAYAGGFQDPEGFLTVVTAMLNTDLETIFGTDYSLYKAAAADANWETRSKKYQELNRNLVQSLKFVPGWKLDVFRLEKEGIQLHVQDFGYTPKFKDFGFRKEER